MNQWFPTFRRWLWLPVPLPGFWRRRATWGQQKSLLRLILVAIEENLPLSPLVAAWANDEWYPQRQRLCRLADLLRAGTPLADAVEEVRGVLGDEDILAIRFGVQSGTLAAALRERLNDPGPLASTVSPRLRQTFFYLIAMLVLGSVIVTFVQIKIVPTFNGIARDFDMPSPMLLRWSSEISNGLATYWYLFLLAVLAICWLAFSSWPGRRLRRAILTRLIRPLRDLHTADVLEKLSVAVDAGRPVAGALSTLARYHFDPSLRNRLLFIRNEVEQGADIWQSMAAVGLLNPPESRVMETADRVGNRSWALLQIAAAKKQRTMRRLGRWSELALPAVVLLFGAYVLFQALGVFGFLAQVVYSQL
jgi:type II secretory pathway component PulF